MLNKIRKTIESYRMLEAGDRVLTAVSGGPDSVALLKVLHMLADHFNVSLVIAHLNHGLRGEEADRDEEFVRMLGQSMQIMVISRRLKLGAFQPKGRSLEEYCRQERYGFLKETAASQGATKIALGHHRQDQVETVLINFLRGSGSEGLHGMLPVRGNLIIRPLLDVTRREILSFLEKERLSFMTDSTNDEDFCLRNRIRHHLMPVLKETYNPRLEEGLSQTAEIMRRDDDFLRKETGKVLQRWGVTPHQDENRVPLDELVKLHEALQYRTIKTLLAGVVRDNHGAGYRHVRAVVNFAHARGGSKSLDLPGDILLRREYDMLILSRKMAWKDREGTEIASLPTKEGPFLYPVAIPGCVEILEAEMKISFQLMAKRCIDFSALKRQIAYMDYEAICLPLVLRNVQPGDRMQPLGMEGTKKLKSLFIDEKIPYWQRKRLPLLADKKSILWAAGVKMSHRVRITEGTKVVLKVEIN